MQIFFLMFAIFVISCTVILSKFVTTSFYDSWNSANITNTPEMIEAQSTMLNNIETFDYGIVLLTIFLMIGLVITSFMIPTHPVFLVINIFGIFFLVFLGMVMTNVYGEFVAGDNAIFGTTAETFTYITYIINHLPYIGAILVLITTIVMFSRT